MASIKKVIVIVGATGNQGGSVARTFLNLPNWHVRCIARNPSSEKALALVQLGAEVIQADLSAPETLPSAFANANAIFLNTDFIETYKSLVASGESPENCSQTAFDKEVFNGKNAVVAAAGVPSLERFVYSSLPSMRDASNGKYTRSFHAESKASIVKYIEAEQPELAKKLSILYAGAYTTNNLLAPTLDPKSGQYILMTPCSPQAKIAILDPLSATGLFVRALVEDEEIGIKLLAYNNESFLNFTEIVQLWSKVTGKEAQYFQVSADEIHQQLGLPYELLDAVSAIADKGYEDMKGVVKPDQLKNPPKTQTFEAWLRQRDVKELLGDAPKA
jgi:NAD(P)-dependent dehydrogenase (short-subunit alcohol dehydrogenase family)